ncbi:MAG: enoyl-ACP reductase [Candidatus Gastranaerophilales bacterium]|nr:enoyl-ACP reductase [Candidatus Gastranaerophilales bacterium]
MNLMKGKKGVIFGVSNKHGIAYGIANELYNAGAEIAFTYASEVMEKRVTPIAQEMNAKIIMECDVTNEEAVKKVFSECERVYGKIDFVVHSVAFANKEDLEGEFINTTKEGWDLALGVSAYSLVSIARNAQPVMNEGGSIFALTYLGSEYVVANYNVMGVAKAALESSVRYLASDLGKYGIRVNAISAGAVKTLAAKGISGFDKMLKAATVKAPLNRNVTLEDIGKAGVYLASDLSSGTTGQILFVDCGCHCVYASGEEMQIMSQACQSAACC